MVSRRTRMADYERILLPVAGDGDVETVVDHAHTLAAALDAELVALHVVDPDADETETAPAGEAGTVENPRSPEAVFEAVADRIGDVSLERATVEGEPGDVIVEQVEARDCDFVVMGTHRRQGLDRLVTGSVADHVGKAAAVPVTTIVVD